MVFNSHCERRVGWGCCIALCATFVCGPGMAFGAPASVTIDDVEPELTEADDGGWTASLGFTNLTDAEITLAVAAVEPRTGCEPTLDDPKLLPAAHADVKLKLPAGCNAGEDRVAVAVTTEPPGLARFSVSAKAADEEPGPNWEHLLVFPVGLVLAFGFVWGTWRMWCPPPNTQDGIRPNPGDASSMLEANKPPWNGPLEFLDATYSFKESWVSNVTALGAVLTGVFGSSDVIEAALGADAKDSIGLAIIGAAIAVGFIAAGTVIPLALKAGNAKSFTVIGILLGATVTLAGAVGELYVMAVTGLELDFGAAKWVLLPLAFVLALVLLYAYARTALRATLNQGHTRPKDEPSDAVEAAEMIVAALKAKADIDEARVDQGLTNVRERYPGHDTSPGDEPFARRRAAAL